MDAVEVGKRGAAYRAVDENIDESTRVVGVGSGSTVIYAVDRLAERCKADAKLDFVCVPTSFQSRQLIVENGLQLADLGTHPVIDVTIDGADEIDPQLNAIKGGGGCHLMEKCVAFAASRFILIADSRKQSSVLGSKWTKGVPLEVVPFAYVPVMRHIERELGGKPVLRMAKSKTGPVVTDSGNFVVDVVFGELGDQQVAELNTELLAVPGVVETGLFVAMASKAYIGNADGSVTVCDPK